MRNLLEHNLVRLIGYVVLPILAAAVAWPVCANWFGETRVSQGVCVFSLGLTAALFDVGYRVIRGKGRPIRSLIDGTSRAPTLFLVPVWILGLLLCGYGVYMALTLPPVRY